MNPLPFTSTNDHLPLWVWRPTGILTEADINRAVAFIDAEEERSEQPFNRFTDLTGLEGVDLDFHFVFGVSLHRRVTYAGHSPVKSAFLATSDEAKHAVKLHVLMTDHSPLQCALFETIEEAADWLGVPIDALSEAEREPSIRPASTESRKP